MLKFRGYDDALEILFGDTEEAEARYKAFMSNKVPKKDVKQRDVWRARRTRWRSGTMNLDMKHQIVKELGGKVRIETELPEDFTD